MGFLKVFFRFKKNEEKTKQKNLGFNIYSQHLDLLYIFWGYLGFQNSLNFLCSSNQKKSAAVQTFPPQNQSKLACQTGQNH